MPAPSHTELLTLRWGRSVSPCFHPEHEEDLALHQTLTQLDQRELDLLRADALAEDLALR